MKKAVLYVVIVLIGIVLVDFSFNSILRRSSIGIERKIKLLFEDSSYYDVWFIGSSRAETSYETNLLEKETDLKFLNAGVQGAKPQQVFYTLKCMLEKHTAPKRIFFEIDLHNLLSQQDTIFNTSQYLPFLYIESLRKSYSKIDPRILYFYYLPPYELPQYSIRGIAKILRRITNRPSMYDTSYTANGSYHAYLKMNTAPIINNASAHRHINVSCHQYIDSIILLAQKKDIDITLIIAPMYVGVNTKSIKQQIKNIASIHRIPYVDYSFIPDISNNKDLFSDPFHLNIYGSRKFTNLFLKEVKL